MKRVLIVCAQHGNELLGIDLVAHITRKYPDMLEYVDSVIANPEAVLRNERYVDADMNRSYGDDSSGRESELAQKLLATASSGYDVVLDMHTTTCKMPPTAIISSADDVSIQHFLRYTNLEHVVVMADEMVERSLIGSCPAALSIEVNREEATSVKLLDSLAIAIKSYVRGDDSVELNRAVYLVDGRIAKSSELATSGEQLENYKKTSTGIYPVLVGENSYKKQTDYLGFSASRKVGVSL